MSYISIATTKTLIPTEPNIERRSTQVQAINCDDTMMSQSEVRPSNNGYYHSIDQVNNDSPSKLGDSIQNQPVVQRHSPMQTHAPEYQIYGTSNIPNRLTVDRELGSSTYTTYDNRTINDARFFKSEGEQLYDNKSSLEQKSPAQAQNDWDRLGKSQVMNGRSQDNTENIYGNARSSTSFSPKQINPLQSFQNTKSTALYASHTNQPDSTIISTTMPVNVKAMILHGISGQDVIRQWLSSIRCEEYLKNFVDNGYDIQIIMRMTPQDLTAIGFKSPGTRRKLLSEIKKLNLDDDIPSSRQESLESWLNLLKLGEYYQRLCDEGYDTVDKVCDLTWEDLEEIGIKKLGHQKRLLLGIERLKKLEKQHDEIQNDYSIYDVHPNHRISLNDNSMDARSKRLSTLGRSTIRSGFFHSKSGTNLGNRGLPVATVIPALKHVNSSLANLDISGKETTGSLSSNGSSGITPTVSTIYGNKRLSLANLNGKLPANDIENGLKMSDFAPTIRRTAPPLPPTRTNSLKVPQDQRLYQGDTSSNTDSNIYGTQNSTITNYAAPTTTPMSANSFLRAPRLGNLTATTNKMLSSGGHLTLMSNGQAGTMRYLHPVREAPTPQSSGSIHPTQPPPAPPSPPAPLPESAGDDLTTAKTGHMMQSKESPVLSQQLNNIQLDQTSIVHQLASADEFPPPPPPSAS